MQAFACHILRAVTVLDRLPFLDHENFLFAALAEHFEGREYPSGTTADNHNIVIHFLSLRDDTRITKKAKQKRTFFIKKITFLTIG